MFDITKSPWVKIPLKDLQEPVNGKVCYCNYYWIVTKDRCILNFNKTSYQCNTNKIVMDKYIEMFPECGVEFFEVLYLDNNVYESY